MTDFNAQPDSDQRLSEFVDWAIFGLGVLSLTIAITATVLSHTSLFSADQTGPASTTTNV